MQYWPPCWYSAKPTLVKICSTERNNSIILGFCSVPKWPSHYVHDFAQYILHKPPASRTENLWELLDESILPVETDLNSENIFYNIVTSNIFFSQKILDYIQNHVLILHWRAQWDTYSCESAAVHLIRNSKTHEDSPTFFIVRIIVIVNIDKTSKTLILFLQLGSPTNTT